MIQTPRFHALWSARCARRLLLGLLAVVVSSSLASQSHAFIIGSYSLMVGESARYLRAIYDFNQGDVTATQLEQVRQEESCKNPSIRLIDRSQPAVLIENTSAQANEISSMVIELQESGYTFGLGDVGVREFPGQPALPLGNSSPGVTINASYDGATNKLKIDFTGLGQGEVAIFRLDLDPGPGMSMVFPDYRSVMLGSDPGTGPTDPALVSAVFSMAGMDDLATEPQELDGPDTVDHAGELEVYHSQIGTEMFGHDGETIVPEPATVSLLGLASLALLVRRRAA